MSRARAARCSRPTHSGPAQCGSSRWAAGGLVVQLPGGRIEVHNGRHVHMFSIPPQAKMLDYAENTLLYRIGNTLHGR